ncbi:DUF2970 domain-containing protein [Hydrogenophaga sp. T2]|jgi:hypothetical protein|uniref:DUF2970 domain-containing protein n=1 Tax=Hydrogenophaga sp. T2 TaxID=3132823 RepID=UPI003CF10BC7
MTVMREVRTVLWGFIGVARRKRLEGPQGHPLVIIAVGFCGVAVFMGLLALLAHWAVRSL